MSPTLNLRNVAASIATDWSKFSPSEQQAAVRDWVQSGRGSANVIAVAGSGKTTTLRWICQVLSGTVAFAAYNKKIADEIGAKLAADGISRNVQARTFHSFGLAAWKRVAPRVRVDGDKLDNLAEELGIRDEMQSLACKLVSLGKNHVLYPETPPRVWEELVNHFSLLPEDIDPDKTDAFVQNLIAAAKSLLQASIATNREVIDFDDMIFAPLIHEAPIYQNDWVLVDEAQDTNPARRELAKRMLKPGGRAIFVGDPRQAIYGFTGADADALDIIAREFGCIDLPLTITYRCPKKVVAHAQRWVSHIQAADTAPEGELRVVSASGFEREHTKLDANAAVLCRLTKPLVQIAFDLIRKKIPCHVEGRDIGRNLITLTKKYKLEDARENYEALSDWAANQISKLQRRKKEAEAQSLQDKIDTLGVIVDFLEPDASVHALRAEITSLFDDTPEGERSRNVTLSTVHKAKGREWPTVYLYGRTSFMPSRFAKQAWQLDQEDNLIYVAVTRAMQTLVEVDLNAEDPEPPKGGVEVDKGAYVYTCNWCGDVHAGGPENCTN